MTGRTLGRYRIVEQVGSGGMAVVYRGVDSTLDREVAVKVLHPHLAGKDDSRRRFSREARAVARLHHPNILEIYDFSGEEAEEAFIVTEFIRGQTLRQVADLQPFDPPEIAAMAACELAAALGHAHEQGIVHRDLKPENVMVREDGALKLMDFGIAKVLDKDERMTMTGALVGSPAHMAPEIIEGEEAGPEADVFSLGTLLYWLATRKLPFAGANTTQTLKRILDGQYPDPVAENPAVSAELSAVLARCLARNPEARYGSASELRDALLDLLQAVGLERPAEELASFFLDPPGYREKLRHRLVEALLVKAREQLQAAKTAKALSTLDRVLALSPEEPRARELLASIRSRSRRRRRAALLLGTVSGAALAAGGAVALVRLFETRRARPDSLGAPAVTLSPQPPSPPPASSKDPEPSAPLEREEEPSRAAQAHGRAAAEVLLTVLPAPYATVKLDGQVLARDTTRFAGKVHGGKHRLLLEHPGCIPYAAELSLSQSAPPPVVKVRLTPKPASLSVENEQNAGVMVDEVLKKTADESLLSPILIPMGEEAPGVPAYRRIVTVKLFKEGFKDHVLRKELHAGESAKLSAELELE